MEQTREDPRAPFELSKWYLDCVGDDGDVFIAYGARVRWRALALHYTSTLVQRAGQETVVQAVLRSAPSPVVAGGVLSWAAPALQPNGASALCAAIFGALTWLALGVDFPESGRRFARLV